jgi:hypothetical protein
MVPDTPPRGSNSSRAQLADACDELHVLSVYQAAESFLKVSLRDVAGRTPSSEAADSR